jgi:endonuclease/exonuclease/phosphatase family metal-dependent hydrolase
VITASAFAQSKTYTYVSYNVENLFDADGIAVFDDYKTTDRDGAPQYTKEDVLTKIQHAVQVLKEFNDGKGPDIVAFVELESDFTPGDEMSASAFLKKYQQTTLSKMLGEDFNDEIANLPSQLLLLKGMSDAGLWKYELAVGKSELNGRGEPNNVQKAVTYSRFPILNEKTKILPVQRARPILETWIEIEGEELVVFNNHWKSGAGSAKMEEIRLLNAEVLRRRLNELLSVNPAQDIIISGDFNSDYNQKYRYGFDKTAINDVLRSTGDEQKVANGNSKEVFNLWYELPVNKRGSDTYRGKWGTLMQIMISSGMYDNQGLQYIDNSFAVGDMGFNTYSASGEPKRWNSAYSGSGYSDHLPVYMQFKVADKPVVYNNFSVNDDAAWKPIEIRYQVPTQFITETDFTKDDPRNNAAFFDKYVKATATVTKNYDFVMNGITYDVYTPSFRLGNILPMIAGSDQKVEFYGRFSKYKGNWQFIIESPEYIKVVQ